VGLANGAVILYRGDIARDRFAKPKTLHKGTDPITGLGFRDQGRSTHLFVATSNYLDCYLTATTIANAKVDIKERIDEQGCDLACCCVSEPDQDFILAKPEVATGKKEVFF